MAAPYADSRTSLSDWELVDDEQTHHRTSVGRSSRAGHNNHDQHVRHVGSLHRPAAKAHSNNRTGDDFEGISDDFEDTESEKWHSTIEFFDRQDVRMSALFTDAGYGQEMLFNIFPELKGVKKRTPLVPMPVRDIQKSLSFSLICTPALGQGYARFEASQVGNGEATPNLEEAQERCRCRCSLSRGA